MSGLTCSICCCSLSICVSLTTMQLSADALQIRSARIFICCALSSPDTYSTRDGKFIAICRTSVLFPMPGSPPISINSPGTMPPPNTRSSSSLAVVERFISDSSTLLSGTAVTSVKIFPVLCACDKADALSTTIVSSVYVFHSPHCGHRPTHFGLSAPHSLQT